MGIDRAVSDSGPLIHLSEVSCFHCLEIVEKIYIPEAVASEVKSKDAPGKSELDKSSWIATVELNKGEKQKADKIASDSGIEATDAETIVLARMWDIKYLWMFSVL